MEYESTCFTELPPPPSIPPPPPIPDFMKDIIPTMTNDLQVDNKDCHLCDWAKTTDNLMPYWVLVLVLSYYVVMLMGAMAYVLIRRGQKTCKSLPKMDTPVSSNFGPPPNWFLLAVKSAGDESLVPHEQQYQRKYVAVDISGRHLVLDRPGNVYQPLPGRSNLTHHRSTAPYQAPLEISVNPMYEGQVAHLSPVSQHLPPCVVKQTPHPSRHTSRQSQSSLNIRHQYLII